MQLSSEIISDVLATYQKTRSPYKTATQCGVSVADVFAIIDANKEEVADVNQRYNGEGRPELRKYLVGKRRVMSREGWDNEDEKIAKARQDYANGTHEMCTGRDGAWLLLYSIQRRVREKGREDYFKYEATIPA